MSSTDHPNIPVSHFLSALKRAMEDTVELIQSEIEEDLVIQHLRKSAEISRPWAAIETALDQHDVQLEWLKDWCRHSIPLL